MRFSLFIEQHIPWFNVPVQNSVLMGIVHRARQLCDYFHRPANRYYLTLNCFIELATFDQIHAEVATTITLTNLVNWNDRWMIQASRCLGFEAASLTESFGTREATSFSKRGSPRSGSQNGSSLSTP